MAKHKSGLKAANWPFCLITKRACVMGLLKAGGLMVINAQQPFSLTEKQKVKPGNGTAMETNLSVLTILPVNPVDCSKLGAKMASCLAILNTKTGAFLA